MHPAAHAAEPTLTDLLAKSKHTQQQHGPSLSQVALACSFYSASDIDELVITRAFHSYSPSPRCSVEILVARTKQFYRKHELTDKPSLFCFPKESGQKWQFIKLHISLSEQNLSETALKSARKTMFFSHSTVNSI